MLSMYVEYYVNHIGQGTMPLESGLGICYLVDKPVIAIPNIN